MDIDDISQVNEMDVDAEESDMGSISSMPDDSIDTYEQKLEADSDALFEKTMNDAVRELWDVQLDNMADLFNFLPDPELENAVVEGEADPDPATTQMRRLLIDDDTQSHTWHWHPSAGRVYRYEPIIYQRWKTLFTDEGTTVDGDYRPFSSRLDWEMAQWAVKEKITQSSFTRLLRIPEVMANSNRIQ